MIRKIFALMAGVALLAVLGCGGGDAAPPQVSVTLTPAVAQSIDQGQTVSLTATVANDPQNQGVTWNITGAGCAGDACGTLSGPTLAAATYTAPATVAAPLTVTITVTSVTDTTKSASVQVTVHPAPAVTTESLPGGTVGLAYSATLTDSGGVEPCTWSISVGSLPAGLTLNSATGAITGTPKTAETVDFTVRVTDSASPALFADKALSITIAPPVLTVTTASLAGGAVDSAYTASLASAGGTAPVTWAVTVGSLPDGLVLEGASGAITGIPTTAGLSGFTVTATDSSLPPQTASKDLSIDVNPVLAIMTFSFEDGTVNLAYDATLDSVGGTAPVTWSVTAGALPEGMVLNGATGVISGTPTAIETANFTVQAVDSSTPPQSDSAALSLKINPQPVTVTTTSLAAGAVGSTYDAMLAATGGLAPITWSVTVGSLPDGLILDGASGEISGTPTLEGATTFTVTATDCSVPALTDSQELTITVNPALSISTAALPNAQVGTAYNQTLASSGGVAPIQWSVAVGLLPDGLTLNPTTGTITGSPTTATTYDFTVEAQDSGTPQQTVQAALSIIVDPAPLTIVTTTLPNGTVGTAYHQFVDADGGTMPLTWSVSAGALPDGVTLNSITGLLSGTPTLAGTFDFTVTVTDATMQTVDQAYSVQVNPEGTNNSELNGHYAFQLQGHTAGGFLTLVGKFQADGAGNLIGVLDSSDASGITSNQAFTGTYSIGADHRGRLTLDIGGETQTAAFAVGGISAGVGNFGAVIDTGTTSWTTGSFRKQDTSAFTVGALNGGYAFGGMGVVDTGMAGFAIAGRFTADGAGSITGGQADTNDGGVASGLQTFTGSYTVGVNGRGEVTLTVGGTETVHLVFYVVSINEAYFVSADSVLLGSANFGGQMLKQSGAFSQASLNGTSVIVGQAYYGTGGWTTIGLGTANGTGSMTVSLEDNDAGTITTENMTVGYTVASTGRVDLGLGAPVFYLVSAGKAFGVGTEGPDSMWFEPRSAGPFSAASLNGNFILGTYPPTMSTASVDTAVVGLDGAGGVTGTGDSNDQGTLDLGFAITDSYAVAANGRTTLGSGEEVGYIVSGSKMFVMSIRPGENNPAISVLQK